MAIKWGRDTASGEQNAWCEGITAEKKIPVCGKIYH